MREIKFRQQVRGKWHYWGYLEPDSFTSPRDIRTPSDQYTGLHDATGREIYEGDIVKKRDYVQVVEWSEMFGGGWTPFAEAQFPSSQVIIIGNIHEHPELIS